MPVSMHTVAGSTGICHQPVDIVAAAARKLGPA